MLTHIFIIIIMTLSINFSYLDKAQAQANIVNIGNLSFEIPSYWEKSPEAEEETRALTESIDGSKIENTNIYFLTKNEKYIASFVIANEYLKNAYKLYADEIKNYGLERIHEQIIATLQAGMSNDIKSGFVTNIIFEKSIQTHHENFIIVNTPYSFEYKNGPRKSLISTVLAAGDFLYTVNVGYLEDNEQAKNDALKIIASMKFEPDKYHSNSQQYLDNIKQWAGIVVIVCIVILAIASIMARRKRKAQ